MPDSEELVVFMTLPLGVQESLIPGVLASRNIPFVLSERYRARLGSYVEIKVPLRDLKTLDGLLRMQSKLESSWTTKAINDQVRPLPQPSIIAAVKIPYEGR
jgi:hypothetical protein